MEPSKHSRRALPFRGIVVAVLPAMVFLAVTASPTAGGDHPWGLFFHKHFGHQEVPPGQIETMNGGAWYWMRSPDQEKTVVMNLFNRYCIRCHGVDGRGVWDIPGVPDFTDVRWQNYRSDVEIVRIIIEGRGAVMPQFRGTLALDEAWGLAHYLRSFVPGTEISKPVLRNPPGQATPAPAAPALAPSGTGTTARVSSVRIPPPNTITGSSPLAR
jgi:Cytochrome C oxidase, cbb3-type, subunit III